MSAQQPYGPVPDATDPSVLANLANTLSPAGVLTQMQAEMGRQQAQRAQVVENATQAATKAGAQYQQAAAAPPPQIDPMTRLLIGMGGDTGSIMSGNPAYRERAQGNLDQMHADLTQNRAQNLASLRDLYQQRAEEARQVGNMDLQLKSSELAEKVGKTLDVLLQNQRDAAALARIGAEGANQLKNTAATGANQQANTRLQGQNEVTLEHTKGEESRKTLGAQLGMALSGGTGTGATAPGLGVVGTPTTDLRENFIRRDDHDLPIPYADLTSFRGKQGDMIRNAVSAYATQRAKAGDPIYVMNSDADKKGLATLKSTMAGVNDVFEKAKEWLPENQIAARAFTFLRKYNDPTVAAWQSNWLQPVTQMTALMSQGTGGRMSSGLIEKAVKNDFPNTGQFGQLADWKDSAEKKRQNIMDLMTLALQARMGVPNMQDRLIERLRADATGGTTTGGTRMMTPGNLGAADTKDEAAAFKRKR